jgi:aminobenzoyl-glutamate utilization protein B
MLHAGKVMALTGAELLETPGLLEEAGKELDQRRSGENYICPIPPEVAPGVRR